MAGLIQGCWPDQQEATPTPAVENIAPDNSVEIANTPNEVPEAVEEQVAPMLLTEVMVEGIQRGMTPEEVESRIGLRGIAAGGDGKRIEVFRYTDSAGNAFTARFDDQLLRTRSGLRVATAQPEATHQDTRTAKGPEAAGDRPVAEIAPGVFIPLERAVASSSGQPRGVENVSPPALAPESVAAGRDMQSPTESRPAVVVAGGRKAAAGDRSYRPRASLPSFTRSLREGSFELRFVNPDDTPIQVGLRQDNLGQDVAVPPGAHASLRVDRGVYELYFVREGEPYVLYDAKTITIDGFQTTDLEIRLDPKDVHVQLIDYGQPE